MLIGLRDQVKDATITVGHIATPSGSSSLTNADTLPASHLQTPRLRQFARFTTTATVTNSANGLLKIDVVLASPARIKLLGVLGHNLVESDLFELQLYSDSAFTTTVRASQSFDCTRTSQNYLTTPGSGATGLPRLNGYEVLPGNGLTVGSMRFTFARGVFRGSNLLEIGRLWASEAWVPADQFSREWQIDYQDQGKTDLARNGGMYFSDGQVLRRFTTKFPAMNAGVALGAAGRGFSSQATDLTCYSDVVVAAAGHNELVMLLREDETARYRERMGVYGLLQPGAALQQVALAEAREEFYSGTLTVLERF